MCKRWQGRVVDWEAGRGGGGVGAEAERVCQLPQSAAAARAVGTGLSGPSMLIINRPPPPIRLPAELPPQHWQSKPLALACAVQLLGVALVAALLRL